ncbi:MAG: dihydroorotase [Fimbriimonadaceae bacterium]|nr:MAG: dihydroorotase [Fimbriimonadaceae bacterium]
MRTLLRNGRILDPSQDLDMVGNVLLEDAQIIELGPETSGDADRVIDCSGLWIAPGLVDMHTHLREPGQEHRETIRSGTMAGAAGGYTNLCCMPNTSPPLDNPALVDFILDRAASPDSGGIFVAPVGALTVGQEGEQLSDMAALKRAGVVAVSDEGNPIQNARVMMRAMETCLQIDLPIMAHCEEKSLSEGGCINEGTMSALLGLPGIPRTAEEIAVMRNGLLSLNTGCRLHVMRVSTWGTIEIIGRLKDLGAPVTCDVCPHHFILTEEEIGEFNPHFKTSPPLRTQVDLDIVMQGLAGGVIDAIASDHSPYASHEVSVPIEEAPFGGAALETTLGATLTYLTHPGVLSPLQTFRKLSTTPTEILRLDAGTLRPAATAVAQIVLVDPNVEWSFDPQRTFSRGKNSPFAGAEFRGKVVMTMCGVEVYRDPLFDESRFATPVA